MKKEGIYLEFNSKKQYVTPTLNCIVIDNEISLSLQSEPINPDEPGMQADIGSFKQGVFKV